MTTTTTTTVTYLPTGERWTVPAFGTRPSHGARMRAALHGRSTRVANGGFTPCAGCARFIATTDATVTVNGAPFAVGIAQVDRVVNDHPAFRVDGAPVAYAPATTVLVCARCNGAPTARAQVLDGLEVAALARLRRYA
jgi:uncharacterized Zn-binding protein involved in type VI secretion